MSFVSFDALEVAQDEGLLPYLERLDRILTESPDVETEITAVRSALGIDLALLRKHPEALWSCLYARCAFVDSPMAQQWALTGWKHGEGLLWRRCQDWLSCLGRQRAGRRWVKSMRPPEYPLDAGLLAQWHCPREGVLSRFEPHTVVMQSRGRELHWNYETGEVSSHPLAELPLRYAVRSDPWNGAALIDTEGRELFHTENDLHLSSRCFDREQRRVALKLYNLDGDYEVRVHDCATGAQLYRRYSPSGSAFHLSGNGQFLLYGGESIQAHDLSSGRELVGPDYLSWFKGIAREAITSSLISDDGFLIAVMGPFGVRVFDGRKHAHGLYSTPGIGAAFSPDGLTLASEQRAVDAISGAPLGTVPYSIPRYLEGGPPPHNTQVSDRNVVVVDGDVTVYDHRTGKQVARHDPAAFSRARFALAGDGERFAIAQLQQVRVFRVDGKGQSVLTVPEEVEAIALSHDATWLAAASAHELSIHRLLDGTLVDRWKLEREPRDVAFVGGSIAVVDGAGATLYALDGAVKFRAEGKGYSRHDGGFNRLAAAAGLEGFVAGPAVHDAGDELGLSIFELDGQVLPFPAAGPWVIHPSEPILAAQRAHVEVRSL